MRLYNLTGSPVVTHNAHWTLVDPPSKYRLTYSLEHEELVHWIFDNYQSKKCNKNKPEGVNVILPKICCPLIALDFMDEFRAQAKARGIKGAFCVLNHDETCSHVRMVEV